jgi:hypothetical protein
MSLATYLHTSSYGRIMALEPEAKGTHDVGSKLTFSTSD